MSDYFYSGSGNMTYLTKGGNILLCDINGKYSFHTSELKFIREVSNSEGNYILSNNPTQITVHCELHSEFAKYCVGLGEFPTWHFVKSICVEDNYTNFKAETSCDGGDYSFHTYHDWYVAQYPNGEWKFAFVERYSTSAKISYDELNQQFQSDLGTLYLKNACEPCPSYSSQRGIEWRDEQEFYSSEEVVEKIGQVASFFDLWNEQYEYIPSRWDEEDEAEIVIGLSFSLKKEIIIRLKELGVTKQDSKPSLRGHRRGGRR